jgi:hypothetical protein
VSRRHATLASLGIETRPTLAARVTAHARAQLSQAACT